MHIMTHHQWLVHRVTLPLAGRTRDCLPSLAPASSQLTRLLFAGVIDRGRVTCLGSSEGRGGGDWDTSELLCTAKLWSAVVDKIDNAVFDRSASGR